MHEQRPARDAAQILLRTSPWETTVAIAAGLASGACNAALLGWLNHALAEPARPLIYVFCALVAGKLITGQVARQSLARVSASTLAAQRSALAKSILATPLRRLEVLGTSRLLAVLTEDVAAIGAALSVMPSLAVNVAVLAGGTAYLFWLSPMLGLLVAAIVGTGLLILQNTGDSRACSAAPCAPGAGSAVFADSRSPERTCGTQAARRPPPRIPQRAAGFERDGGAGKPRCIGALRSCPQLVPGHRVSRDWCGGSCAGATRRG